jgi:flagellar biogenesis protein FliO
VSTELQAMPAASAASGLPASLPLRRGGETDWQGSGMGSFGAMSIVLAVALLLTWGLSRRRGGAATAGAWRGLWPAKRADALRVLQSTRLTSRSSLHVVAWDGREWLVGCGDGGGVSLIASRAPGGTQDVTQEMTQEKAP